MNKIWEYITKLDKDNVVHKRSGVRIGDVSEEFILGRARDELDELIESPGDIHEMADTLALLVHYCVRKGWSVEDIEEAIRFKLGERLSSE